MSKSAKVLGIVLAAAAVCFYFPPIGERIEIGDLADRLAPDTPHGTGTFIRTSDHVYYRVRLDTPVGWRYTDKYLQLLEGRGFQFRLITTSPHAPLGHATGNKIGIAWEAAADPYTIEYRKSADDSGAPALQVRWPWLYVRFGPDIQTLRRSVLVPRHDLVTISVPLPRPSGTTIKGIETSGDAISILLVAQATEAEALAAYADLLRPLSSKAPIRSDHVIEISPTAEAVLPLGGPRRITVEATSALFWDDPVLVYPIDFVPISPRAYPRQPPLPHLPHVTPIRMRLQFDSSASAKDIVRRWGSTNGPMEQK